LRGIALSVLDAEPRARVEYFELADTETLLPVDTVWSDTVVAVAVWFGDVRLIDNVVLKPVAPQPAR
jgi:pantoate--beta-alanine ligase